MGSVRQSRTDIEVESQSRRMVYKKNFYYYLFMLKCHIQKIIY
jgi:hypothetical protein